jgi:WD40 repeat protein
VYDPASGAWSATGSLNTATSDYMAVLLSNGKVLVAGGGNGSVLTSAQLYDPASGTWSDTGNLNTPRAEYTGTLLPDGKVLVAGGYSGSYLDSAELYDPASGTWTATGSLATTRASHTGTLLPNGKVLVAGGSTDVILATAELYDPASGTWSATGSLTTGRGQHTGTLLPNGKVLVAGGYDNVSPLASAELYDSATPTPTPTPSYSAQVQPPINADGTSVFTVKRGVVPVKFTLTQGGAPTCALPPATIIVTRTAGGTTGTVNESVYSMSADTGSNFKIDGCQYSYNLASGNLGAGTYRIDIQINAGVVGSATFQLK